jgi:hypothetical protein
MEHTDNGAIELDEEENGAAASGSGDGRRLRPDVKRW